LHVLDDLAPDVPVREHHLAVDGADDARARLLDKAAQGRLSAIVKRGDLDAKAGSTLLVPDVAGVAATRVLLVSLGKSGELTDQAFRDALTGAAKALASGAAEDAAVALADLDLPGRSLAWRVEQASRILADGAYRFDFPSVTKKNGAPAKKGARRITLTTADAVGPDVEQAARRGLAIAEGMALTKDLGNLGGNVCTPTYLAETALALGKELGFQVEVLERSDMEKLGMGSALSVGRASHEPCKFIVMHYRGGDAKRKPIVLVGKGLTFDTGGISLKPGDDLDMMKYDMCGGARESARPQLSSP